MDWWTSRLLQQFESKSFLATSIMKFKNILYSGLNRDLEYYRVALKDKPAIE